MRLNMFVRTVSLLLATTLFYGCPSEELTSARLYVKEKNWEKAEEMLTAAMEATPEESEPYFLMGKEIYARNGEWAKMNEMFDKAAELGPVNSQDTTEKEDYFHLAIAGFTTAKQIRPDESTSYKNLVKCYIQIKNQEMLEVTLNEALTIDPKDPELLFIAGRNFLDNGDLDAAVEYMERGLKIDPGNSYGAQSLAAAFVMMDSTEAAIFAYTKAIRSEPDNPDLHFNLGVLYLQLGDFEMTEEKFQQVLRINPDDSQAAIGMGEAYEGMERWEDAEYYYRKALRSKPDNPTLLRNLGVVIYRQGRMEEGQEYLDKAKRSER